MVSKDGQWLTLRAFLEEHPEVSRNLVYREAKRGHLPSIQVGSKLLIRRDAFDLLLEKAQSPVTEEQG